MSNSNLKQLTDKWYAKLEKEGFDDIENRQGQLKSYHSTKFIKNIVTYDKMLDKKVFTQQRFQEAVRSKMDATAEYHRLAEHFLHSHDFQSNIQHEVWRLHTEGESYRDIAEILKKKRFKAINKDKVQIIITALYKQMLKEANDSDDQ